MIIAVVATALGMAGCDGHQQSLSSVLPHKSSFPSATYSESRLRRCLVALHILAGDQTLENVRAGLSQNGAVPEGLTGEIPVTGAGAAETPIGKALDKARGSNKLPPGVSFGPLVNSATLVFFKSQKLAEKGAKRLVDVYLLSSGVPESDKSFFADLYGPPPPLSAIRGLVALAGNVLVIWRYPLAHVGQSKRILSGCLAASKE